MQEFNLLTSYLQTREELLVDDPYAGFIMAVAAIAIGLNYLNTLPQGSLERITATAKELSDMSNPRIEHERKA